MAEDAHWSAVSANPNDAKLLSERQALIRSARRPATTSRLNWLAALVSGATVLDVGCVDHLGPAFQAAPLHRALALSSAKILGVDINAEGVAALNNEGFDVLVADVTTPGLAGLVGVGYDYMVAGEIIEHLLDLSVFFTNVAEVLGPQGRLVLTSPNPHALALIFYNWRGKSIDNVDHVSYHWPSGLVEIAIRTGFVIEQILGERRLGPRRQLPIHLAARVVGRILPASYADCKSLIYVLRRS